MSWAKNETRNLLQREIYESHRSNTQIDLKDDRRLNGSQLAWAGYAADALLATGWVKPRTITTVEELDTLPKLSVVRASNGYVMEKLSDGWARSGVDYPYAPNPFWLPAAVLHEGKSEKVTPMWGAMDCPDVTKDEFYAEFNEGQA